MAQPGQHRSLGVLRAIAVFKFFKALLLLAVVAGSLSLLRNPSALTSWLMRLTTDVHGRLVEAVLARLFQLDPKKLEAISAGAAVYAAIFLVEGVGLWMARRWAEYLTILSTAGFLPLETVELVHKFSVERVAALVINAAILVYLIWRVRSERRGHGNEKQRSANLSSRASFSPQ